ncbi:HIT family protein [Aspergillus ruber CBS 135680]|uniref:Bis(5'-adenosyl)-triphosphatase n=1 Tax=Aspergillus ruber (strain CBS 135680) TaxID=1388766 RepID=A0A017SM02_ASPRC|nr:putative Bis-tetraphosphatase [Aspergillus ruber CBS 135680]EYE97649.1 putative Bis-tetraphosphatase [Aspergillus ruber CBS 135680]
MPPALIGIPPIHFGPFVVTTQVFHLTPTTFALVNLKPILPGHVLVSPRRIVPRVADLTPSETTDLFLTVRRVGRMIERVYGASSLNIAIQDGVDAGQSVPHVHAHVIPRQRSDLDHLGGTDAIYDKLDGEEGDVGRIQKEEVKKQLAQDDEGGRRTNFPAVDNDARKPRGMEEMEAEATMLAREMEKEPLD